MTIKKVVFYNVLYQDMKKFTITIASLLLIRYLGSTIIPTVQFFISHPGDVVIFIYRNLPSLSTDFAVTM